MTIDEAITLIQSDIDQGNYELDSPLENAARLGIEALNRLKDERETIGRWHARLLPGETEP